jgi:hypothetical protein
MCKVCNKEVKNNTCKECSIMYLKNKTICQRHNWNIVEYVSYLKKKGEQCL